MLEADRRHVLNSFVTASQAASQRLAFVNTAGNAIMKVDNTTVVPLNDKRNTVRISTKDRFAVGSVWIADMLHVPFGVNQAFAPVESLCSCALCQCSVWPAFWSQAPNWPKGGEIDTFEGVNMAHNSQSSLHTEPGCTVVNAVQTSTLVNSADCSFLANANEGCSTQNPDPNSYGAAFAAAGGGVFVTEFAETGISCVPFFISGSAVHCRAFIARNSLLFLPGFGSSRYIRPVALPVTMVVDALPVAQ
jgi:hypothetical protein